MKRNLNWKKVWKYSVIFWGVIFVVSLIPIILLSTYNFPCADASRSSSRKGGMDDDRFKV